MLSDLKMFVVVLWVLHYFPYITKAGSGTVASFCLCLAQHDLYYCSRSSFVLENKRTGLITSKCGFYLTWNYENINTWAGTISQK
jgi:hypothetical protein